MALGAVGFTISGTGFRFRMGLTEETGGKDDWLVVTSEGALFGVTTLGGSLASCISGTSPCN